MYVWEVVAGMATAAFLVHFRNVYTIAQKQRVIAIRLNSYLNYWKIWVLQNDVFGVYYLGVEWNKETKKIVRLGGTAEDLVKLEGEKKKRVDEIKAAIKSGAHEMTLSKEELESVWRDSAAQWRPPSCRIPARSIRCGTHSISRPLSVAHGRVLKTPIRGWPE